MATSSTSVFRAPPPTIPWGGAVDLRVATQADDEETITPIEGDKKAVEFKVSIARDWGAPHLDRVTHFTLTIFAGSLVLQPVGSLRASFKKSSAVLPSSIITNLPATLQFPKGTLTATFTATPHIGDEAQPEIKMSCPIATTYKQVVHLDFTRTATGFELAQGTGVAPDPWCTTRALSAIERWWNPPVAPESDKEK